MDYLYGEKHTREDKFTFQVNQGGAENIRVSNGSPRDVVLVFRDGKFVRAHDDVEGAFAGSRSHWMVRGAIADKIREIEARLNEA